MRTFRAASLALACALGAAAALAQDYPARPIRTILPFTGGGETSARVVCAKLGEVMGATFVLESQSAAGGVAAYNLVARAEPDGHTLLYGISSLVLRQFLVKDISYDALRDFTPIAQLGSTTFGIFANSAFPESTLKGLIQYAKDHPGKVSYATAGIGTTQQLAGYLLEKMAGIRMLMVPYKAEANATADVLAGRVDLLVSTTSTITPLVRSGKGKLLAIPSERRYPNYPDVPTAAELLPGYEIPPGFFGFFGPARLPQPIVKRLSQAIIEAGNAPEVKGKLAGVGVNIHTAPAEEFARTVRRNYEITARFMKEMGVKPE